ncbi:MAG: threonylcarbamoyl-AMP synthase [Synergistaceae bacterium]|jgi:L-threonylcarbamoyladenylate synthase|nr:threonylcarbamoyl-AMP synthase [Synergistaceae bacterium]
MAQPIHNERAKKIFEPTEEYISKAAEILKRGGLVAFPTETVYGLGANALDERAVGKIFEAKGRPCDNPLILHISSADEASLYAEVTPGALALMERFWPGPLTIVLRAADIVPLAARGGLETVALRAPANPVALALIRKIQLPLAGPSANKSGRPSPTRAIDVLNDIGDAVDMILDGGETRIGVESTVVDATERPLAILRPGAVTREMLAAAPVEIAEAWTRSPEKARRSPGTRYRHYAPSVELRLWEDDSQGVFGAEGAWCYMGMRKPPEGALRAIIFATPEEYAHGLFSTMRELERCGAKLIIADFPDVPGLGEAIRNRLSRAAGRY